MKYIKIAAIVILLSFTATATACGGDAATADVPAREIVMAAVAAYDAADIPDSLFFVHGVDEGSENYLDPDTVALYFKGEFAADMPELGLLSDYAIHMPNTKRVFEIDILVSHTEEGLAAAKSLLESRLAQKNNGDIQNYTPQEVPLLESADIYLTGNYAILLATPDNSIAETVIENMIGAVATAAVTETEVTTPAAADGINVFESFIEAGIGGETVAETADPVDAGRSEIPDITLVIHNENNRILIGGTCAADAVIHMRGGVDDLTYKCDDGNFMGNPEIPESGSAVIYVTAEQPGRAESEPYVISVTARTDINLDKRMGAYHHIIGADYQGFVVDEINDRIGGNILSDKQVQAAEKRIADRVEYLKGIGCELVYLIIPTPMHVYPELVPERFPLNTGITRTEQFETAATGAGAIVINLFDLFTEHKNDEYKIYHKTDTHWTQYGAYLGYCELMKYVSQKWPDAAARGRDEVEFYKKQVMVGDIAEHTDTDQSLMHENATFMNLLFDTDYDPEIYHTGTCRLTHDLCSFEHTTENKRPEQQRPSAYVMRDSFGTPMYSLVSDAFESVHWEPMWSYEFDKKEISSFAPDYVIYIITERNIGSVIR